MRTPKRPAREDDQLDLIGFMNLASVLIPLLLVSAVFAELATIDVKAPAISDETSEEPAFQLAVAVTRTGFEVRGEDEPRTIANHDLVALGEALEEIKAAHPTQEHLTLLAEDEVPYDLIIQVMDEARVDAAGQSMFPLVSIGAALK